MHYRKISPVSGSQLTDQSIRPVRHQCTVHFARHFPTKFNIYKSRHPSRQKNLSEFASVPVLCPGNWKRRRNKRAGKWLLIIKTDCPANLLLIDTRANGDACVFSSLFPFQSGLLMPLEICYEPRRKLAWFFPLLKQIYAVHVFSSLGPRTDGWTVCSALIVVWSASMS